MEELEQLLINIKSFKAYANVRVAGMMGMASFTTDALQVEREFQNLKSFLIRVKQNILTHRISMSCPWVCRETIKSPSLKGLQWVRIGSLLFKS